MHRGPIRPADRGRSGARPHVGAEERRLTLRDLVLSGLLRAPATIVADYFGRQFHAEVLDDGTIRFGDAAPRSLSAAGEAVKVAARGTNLPQSVLATDGWAFWKARDPDTGDLVPLKELRRRLATPG